MLEVLAFHSYGDIIQAVFFILMLRSSLLIFITYVHHVSQLQVTEKVLKTRFSGCIKNLHGKL